MSDLFPVGDSLSMSIGVPLLTVAERLRNSSSSSLFCWEEEKGREREMCLAGLSIITLDQPKRRKHGYYVIKLVM